MDYKDIKLTLDGAVATITIDRPEVLNAIRDNTMYEIQDALNGIAADDAIRVVVLTALGRVFCAGADVSAGAGAFDTASGEGAKNFGSRAEGRSSDFIGAMMQCRKPSIVAFNGSAAGVGLTLTLPCDIRIAADHAKFGCVFARRGLVPEAGSAWFLPQIVGLPQALRWCYSGRVFDAAEAARGGLIEEPLAPEALLPRAMEIAREIVEHTAPVATAVTRQMLWRFSAEPTPWGALGVDAALNVHLGASADVREGVAAFIEKRPPNFPGKVSADMPPQVPWWPQR